MRYIIHMIKYTFSEKYKKQIEDKRRFNKIMAVNNSMFRSEDFNV
jgi:hypothetical protein